MTDPLLISQFEAVAEAPSGITALRAAVLKLAASGCLLPQDPRDSTAHELLKSAADARDQLITSKAIRKPKKHTAAVDDDRSDALPSTWAWVPLGAIAAYNARDKVQPAELAGDLWLLELEDVEKSTSRLLNRATVSNRAPKSSKSRFECGDVLYGKLRPYLDKVLIASEPGACTTEIVPITPYGDTIDPAWLRWMLKRPAFIQHATEKCYGMNLPRLSTADAVNSMHPLPPLAEQRRIVAKVDELMGLIDELERAREEREAKRAALRDSALAELQHAEDADAVQAAWARVAANMDDLFKSPADIAPLRQTILQLAVRGRLVPQDPGDGHVQELLDTARIEKEALKPIKETACAAPNPEFSIPETWQWSAISEIALALPYGTSGKSLKTGKVPVLRMGNIQRGEIDWSDLKYSSDAEEISQYELPPNSVLFNRTNSPELVGKAGIYRGVQRALYAGYLIRLNLVSVVSPEFINLYLNSPDVRQWCWRAKTDGVSQSNISASKLAGLSVPMPPLAEQRRIVAKVEELMALCDELEQRLTEAETAQTAFASSTIHHLDTIAREQPCPA